MHGRGIDYDNENIDIDIGYRFKTVEKMSVVIIISTGLEKHREKSGEKSKKGEDRKTEAWSQQVPILETKVGMFFS